MKSYLVTLRNTANGEVSALIGASNEVEAKQKALSTARQYGNTNPKSILNGEFSVSEVESWDLSKSRILLGAKRYGVVIIAPQANNEELVIGVAGVKSALTKLLRSYILPPAAVCFAVDVDAYRKPQTPQVQTQQSTQAQKPVQEQKLVQGQKPELSSYDFYETINKLRDKGKEAADYYYKHAPSILKSEVLSALVEAGTDAQRSKLKEQLIKAKNFIK